MSKDQEVTAEEAEVEAPETVDRETEATEQASKSMEALSSEELVLMLEDARSKADEHWNQLIRSKAEMDNLRKRQDRDLENAHKYALERFVNELLPVRDSMELGLLAAQDENADVEKLREGTELTLKLFGDVMEKFTVFQINPEGEPFDPELHQAMTMIPRDDVPPSTVVTVVQKGYSLNGRLVRPAMVIVSQG
ncbi:MAG: nucleotide exchange factor GrpE [Candidatus Sedimenticola sp. (ex Thyasira tokunagai)]